MNDRRVVMLVICILGVVAVVCVVCSYLLLHGGKDATALVGIGGVAVGAVGGLLANTKSVDLDGLAKLAPPSDPPTE